VIAGATSGIGAAIADIFVNEGSKIIIAGRRAAVGETLAARLGASCHFVRTDIASEHQVRTMIETDRDLVASTASSTTRVMPVLLVRSLTSTWPDTTSP
jgi:NADP-dependent 3-hydroxy acid dehydrogenase YdfG